MDKSELSKALRHVEPFDSNETSSMSSVTSSEAESVLDLTTIPKQNVSNIDMSKVKTV